MDTFNVRTHFFPNIPTYLLPLLTIFVLYYILFSLWTALNIQIAEHFIGKIDFLFGDIKAFTQSKEATLEYLSNLPNAKLVIIYGWQALFSFAFFVFSLLTIFWISALFYAKNDSKNPLLALWMSAVAIFKKPLGVIGLNIFIAVVVIGSMSLGGLFATNTVLSFIYMILMIYLAVYLNVLVFSYYEKNL
ncbi:hypothetical protein tpqmel_0947, partial [Candidatus Gastranaerophilus sp. (ex Termes propinquus)]